MCFIEPAGLRSASFGTAFFALRCAPIQAGLPSRSSKCCYRVVRLRFAPIQAGLPSRSSWQNLTLARLRYATARQPRKLSEKAGLPGRSPARSGERRLVCAREDLNLQSFRNQILSLARLPFRHARNRHQVAPRAAESQARFCSARLRKRAGLFRFRPCHFGSGWQVARAWYCSASR